MKLFRFAAVILFSALALTLVQSCNSDNVVSNTDDSGILESFSVYDYDLSLIAMQDGTLDTDCKLEDSNPMRPDDDKKDGKRPPHAEKRHPLGRVFAAMNLTDEQKAEIATLMESHMLCEMQWFNKLREARAEIMAETKIARQAILDQVKNGEITREEARQLLNELNKATREALKSLPINEEAKAGIILCREEFLAAIGNLLTDEQKVIWEKFLANIKRG